MTKITWDTAGQRQYQAGLNHGVLYFYDREESTDAAVPWNGLLGVDDTASGKDGDPVYLDGVKYLHRRRPTDYSGKLTAFMYPPEFEQFVGVTESPNGISFHDQESTQSFGLSYRTIIGNDISPEAGYKIHLLYNLMALGDDTSYKTLTAEIEAMNFAWTLAGTPVRFKGYRPTCHVTISSLRVSSDILAQVETILYGTNTVTPRLPTIAEFNGWL